MKQKSMAALVVLLGLGDYAYGWEYIATAPNGSWSSGRSPKEAENGCYKNRGTYCRVMTTNNGRKYWAIPRGYYVSVYQGSNAVIGAGYAGVKGQAWNNALTNCKRMGGTGCTHQQTFVSR